MKALIVLENHFYFDKDNNVWCDRIVDYNYLQRYLNVFDSIILTGRTKMVEKIEDKKLLVSGKNVDFVPMPDFKGAKGLLLNLFKIKSIIKKEIEKSDCAIYRAPTHLSLFTYKEVIKKNKPLALEFMMAADKMFDGDSLIKKILNKFIDKKAKKMCLKADGVSYVTEYVLQDKYPCKAIFKPNNKKYFTESYSSIDLSDEMYYKQSWKSEEKPKLFEIIHTGYMDSYRKGQDVLIKAIKIIVERGYNVKLTLIGDGEKKSEFENLVKSLNLEKVVIFKGLIKEKQSVLNYLRKSHFLVLPTQSEGLPRTLIEGMSQGLVCISSPVDGIPELLDKDFLINYDDVEGYANKLIELMSNWNKCCLESKKNYTKSLKYCQKNLDKKRKKFYNLIIQKINSNR